MNVLKTTLSCFALLMAGACSPASQDAPDNTQDQGADQGVVNLYSSRHYDTDIALYDEFTQRTGIKVNRIEAGADALIERMVSEGEFSPADLLLTTDAGRLWRAEQAGVLASSTSDVLNARIAPNLRHQDGLWYALSKRARVIIYNKAAGRPEGLTRYEDLADPAHRGKVCIRSSSNIYNISLMASLIEHLGEEAATQWAEGVVANFARKPQANDTGQIEAVAAGECQIAVVNTYYIARLVASDDEARRAVAEAIGIIFPNQEDRGTHVNVSGAGLAKHAPNRDNAMAFLEYLTENSAQQYFANGNNEYPVTGDVAPSAAVVQLGSFKEDQISAEALGKNQSAAVRAFDRAGWQ